MLMKVHTREECNADFAVSFSACTDKIAGINNCRTKGTSFVFKFYANINWLWVKDCLFYSQKEEKQDNEIERQRHARSNII
jgi:hypothetical protein